MKVYAEGLQIVVVLGANGPSYINFSDVVFIEYADLVHIAVFDNETNHTYLDVWSNITDENGVPLGSTYQEVIDALNKLLVIGDPGFLGTFENYNALIAEHPTADVGQLVHLINSQGTQWLPYSFGGTFYPKGDYVWNGAIWSSSVDDIANALDILNNQAHIHDNKPLLDDLKVRDNFILIKSGTELEEEFPPVGGVITLTTNIEIEGFVDSNYQLNLGGYYMVGKNAFADRFIYIGNSDAIIGHKGGVIKVLTLMAPLAGTRLFNLEDTQGNRTILLRDVVLSSCVDIGVIKGFNLCALSTIDTLENNNGITFENIKNLYLNNISWRNTNYGTLEKYIGDFELIQNIGGKYHVEAGVTGVDISGITSIKTGELLNSPFTGDGIYITGVPSVEWLINCLGVDSEGDQFSRAFLSYDNGTQNTPLTQNVWDYFDMPTATLDSNTSHRFEQNPIYPDTLIYKGLHNVNNRIVITTGVRRIGGGINTYQMRIVIDGIQIGKTKQFELGSTDTSITLTAIHNFKTDEQIWLEVRNITDNDDIRLLTASLTIK